MKITQEFVVPRSPDTVWEFFQDMQSVAQCLPGAELMGQSADGSYEGSLSVKLGPMTAIFEGIATVVPDPVARRASIEGKGVDKKGGSRGQVKVDYRVIPSGAADSSVTVDADITLSGPAAQFGRTGLINEMSKRLIGDFVACLEAKLAAPTEAEADSIKAPEVRGLSLFFSSLWAAIKRLFSRGA
ncbi:MAG: SRPBCC family protein [Acidimicrobiia bacterium]